MIDRLQVTATWWLAPSVTPMEAGKIASSIDGGLSCGCAVCTLPGKEHVTGVVEAIPSKPVDFALYFFHNIRALIGKGSGLFYLPKTRITAGGGWWSRSLQLSDLAFNLRYARATICWVETLPTYVPDGRSTLCVTILVRLRSLVPSSAMSKR